MLIITYFLVCSQFLLRLLLQPPKTNILSPLNTHAHNQPNEKQDIYREGRNNLISKIFLINNSNSLIT